MLVCHYLLLVLVRLLTSIGLFAPSAGQHLRDEQRRRRSQYDRGTSLAEREEYGFDDEEEDDMHRQSPYQSYSPCE
jgi:hypothetical protein